MRDPDSAGEAVEFAEWRKAYAARLVEKGGLDQEQADDCAKETEVDLEFPASDAPDEEMTYWDADE